MNFKCLVVPSPEDTRDYVADKILTPITTFPGELDLRSELQPVRNQGAQGTCAAHVAACCKEWQEKKDIDLSEHLSPQFVYNLRENKYSEGMYGRDVMKILNKKGIVKEIDFEYGDLTQEARIPDEIMVKAENFRIKNYAKIDNINTLKTSLHQNGPCYIAFPCFNYGERFWKKRQNDDRLGGHAVTVVGYNSEGFLIRNSWGKEWGNDGYCIYSYEDWGSHWEIWTTIDSKSEYIKPPNPDPPPNPEPIPVSDRVCPCVIS